MKLRKILGIGALILGLICIGLSSYITHSVEEGKAKISHAEKQVNTGSSLLSLTPATKELSKGLTDSAHKKIDAGKEEVGKYERIARELTIGGIALLVLGSVSLLMMYKKRSL